MQRKFDKEKPMEKFLGGALSTELYVYFQAFKMLKNMSTRLHVAATTKLEKYYYKMPFKGANYVKK